MIYAATSKDLFQESAALLQVSTPTLLPPTFPPSVTMSRFTFTLSHESTGGVKTEVTKTFAAEQLEYILGTPPLCHDEDVRKWGETISRMNKKTRETVVLENTSSVQLSPKQLSSQYKKRKLHHTKWEGQPRVNGRFVKSDRKGKAPKTFAQPASSHGMF